MENKIKFIIFGLVGLLCIFLFIILQANTAKQAIEREKNNLAREVDNLAKQNKGISQEIRRLQDERDSLKRQLDRASQDKDEIQVKYDMIAKERDVLIERLKIRPSVTEAQKVTVSQTDDVYWGRILNEKTNLELQLKNMNSELKSIQISNEELKRDKATLELDLKNLNRENEDLKRQIEYNRKIMDTLSQEMVIEKNDKFKIQEILNSVKSENTVLRQQLKSLDNRKINLERKLAQLHEENSALSTRLKEMDTFLQEKTLQIDNLKKQLEIGQFGQVMPGQYKESVELPPIVVRPQELETPAVPFASSLAGKILAINKENNFAIIDLGQEQGIRVGDTFQAYREQNAIATLEVIQVRKEIAACNIKDENIPIKVGDTVK